MVNDCIRIGLEKDASNRMKLSNLSCSQLAKYNIISYYKLAAISHAMGILANRKKSLKRGLKPRQPYARQPLLVSCYGFKIINEVLKVPLGKRRYYDIPLNNYVTRILSDSLLRIRSFTLTADLLSINISREVAEIECNSVEGVDRNLHNVTLCGSNAMIQYDLSKAVDIAENTRSIIRSFKRNDIRIRRKIYRKFTHHSVIRWRY